MKKSMRLNHVQSSLTLAITAKANEMKAKGIDVISFGAGEPDFDTPQPIVEAAKTALDEGKTRYTAVAGLPQLRLAIADWYTREFGVPTASENVIVGTGGKQVLYNAMMSVLDPGDTALIPAPYWLSYPAMAALCGAAPVFIDTKPEDQFLLSPETLSVYLDKYPQSLLILNSPCNPTGQAYDKERLLRIIDVLRRYPEVTIIWDNIYAQLVYGDFTHVELTKLAPDLSQRVITCGGFSKTFAMTGWRLGFAIADPSRIKAMSTIQSHSTSNANTFAQYGAIAATQLDHAVVENMRQTFEARRALVMAELSEIPNLPCLPPCGAFYAFPDFSHYCRQPELGIYNDIDLAKYLLDHAHVATVPGTAFGASGHLRFSFALDDESIQNGIRRIARVLKSFRPET